MTNLHRSLHRRDEFPPFAKPKLFGKGSFYLSLTFERSENIVRKGEHAGHQHLHLVPPTLFSEVFIFKMV